MPCRWPAAAAAAAAASAFAGTVFLTPSSAPTASAPCRVTSPCRSRDPSRPTFSLRFSGKGSKRSRVAAASDDVSFRLPSVSVQIATHGRHELLLEALKQIAAQDYPGEVEVIIVDDSYTTSEPEVMHFANSVGMDVDYQLLAGRFTIGEKRNIAALSTAADIICLWDDDDVFPKDRITRQVTALGACGGQIRMVCAISPQYVYSVDKVWFNIKEAIFANSPSENTLCFWRAWFEDGRRFQHVNQGEGLGLFIREGDGQILMLPAHELPFLYMRRKSAACGDGVTRSGLRLYFPDSIVDPSLLSLAHALSGVGGRFPHLPDARVYNAALRQVRKAVAEEISSDMWRLRSLGDPDLAEDYLSRLRGRRVGSADEDGSALLHGEAKSRLHAVFEALTKIGRELYAGNR